MMASFLHCAVVASTLLLVLCGFLSPALASTAAGSPQLDLIADLHTVGVGDNVGAEVSSIVNATYSEEIFVTETKQQPDDFGFSCSQKVDLDTMEGDALRHVTLARLFTDWSNKTSRMFLVDQSVAKINVDVWGGYFKMWKIIGTLPADKRSCFTRLEAEDINERGERSDERSSIQNPDQADGSEAAYMSAAETDEDNADVNKCREYEATPCTGEAKADNVLERDDDIPGCSTRLTVGLKNSEKPEWRLLVLYKDSAADEARAEVTGISSQYFDYVFVNPITMSTLQDDPVADEITLVRVTFSCYKLLAEVSLVITSEHGERLYESDAIQLNTSTVVFHLRVPQQNFYVGVDETDEFGTKFRRISSALNKPKTLALSFVTPAYTDNLSPQQNLDIQVRLRNKGVTDTFCISAKFLNYMGYLKAQIRPDFVEVEQDASKEVHIFVSVHKSVSQEIFSPLIINVTRLSDNHSTFLKRGVRATPTMFGEDKEPPSCTVLSENSQCSSQLRCTARSWEALVAVHDHSGVFRASVDKPPSSTSPLHTSIVYKPVEGRLMATALIRRDCCLSNMSLVVEDYIGNLNTCTLIAPPSSAVDFARLSNVVDRASVQSFGKRAHPSPNTMTTESSFPAEESWTTAATTLTMETDSSLDTTKYETTSEDTPEDGFWSLRLLKRLRMIIIILVCVVFLVFVCTMMLCCYRKRLVKVQGHKRPAFHFRRTQRTSCRDKAHASNQGRRDQIQMASLEQPTSHALKDFKDSSDTRPSVNHRSRHASGAESDPDRFPCNGVDKGLKAESPGCSGSFTRAGGRQNLTSSGGDEAYSSLHSSIRTQHAEKRPNEDQMSFLSSTAKWLSQLNSSSFQPQSKAEIYESILQFRQTLEQLERKRNSLMNSMNFKHHTVPRIKHDVGQAPFDWDLENPSARGHRASIQEDKDHFKSYKPAPSSRDSHSAAENADKESLDGSTMNQNIETESSNTEPCPQSLDHDEVLDQCAGNPSQSSLELSEGHVSMMIEGATQISLRHEILKLRDRLIQCSHDVENALRLKQDMYERWSNAGDGSDSDFEDM